MLWDYAYIFGIEKTSIYHNDGWLCIVTLRRRDHFCFKVVDPHDNDVRLLNFDNGVVLVGGM
jgi:hypothetical protein